MRIGILLISLLLTSCSPSNRVEPITLVVGSWYGYYPFYYAIEQGLDEKYGLHLKVLEPTNIANLRRSYLRDQVDFAATSMIEFTSAITLSKEALSPVLVTDYSNGGDVVVAYKSISNVEALKGKRIAVPSNGIGEYILSLAFNDPQPTRLFEQKKIPETECTDEFENDNIDACVTYPPISTYLLDNPDLHVVYSSAQDPGRIFDVVWAKPWVEEATKQKLLAIWFDIVAQINRNPDTYYEFVAKIANVSIPSVEQAMAGIQLLNKQQHDDLMKNTQALTQDFVNVCKIAEGEQCEKLSEVIKW